MHPPPKKYHPIYDTRFTPVFSSRAAEGAHGKKQHLRPFDIHTQLSDDLISHVALFLLASMGLVYLPNYIYSSFFMVNVGKYTTPMDS